MILQGPPGTGKTRLAQSVLDETFKKNGTTVQFHPAVTYETFIIGISPDVNQSTLSFNVKAGWLVEAVHAGQKQDYLLVIDEINRADLGRVLGEAIYLFEPREIKQGEARVVKFALWCGRPTRPEHPIRIVCFGHDEQRRSVDCHSGLSRTPPFRFRRCVARPRYSVNSKGMR